jgi:acetoacetyl-CoA synthetase
MLHSHSPVQEGDLLWSPTAAHLAGSGIQRYLDWLSDHHGQQHKDYASLWRWSTTDPNAFWASIWRFHDVHHDGQYTHALNDTRMPGTAWFEGARVNYAEHLLRHEGTQAEKPALMFGSEGSELSTLSWHELGSRVRILATQLRRLGVKPGDRVAAYVTNSPEAVIAMMATVAIGAVWTCAAPEFGVGAVVDRFGQIAPKVLITCLGYQFGGKAFDRRLSVEAIVNQLPTLNVLISIDEQGSPLNVAPNIEQLSWATLRDHPTVSPQAFKYERVGWQHPLWILYSSGTTGKPKAIVHGHVGVLTEHLKATTLHLDLSERSVIFFYSTTAWMMWNALVSALLAGSTVVLYDGSPIHPGTDTLWALAAKAQVTHFGASPTFVQLMQKAGVKPAERHDISNLETIVLSGSPATPETFGWFYEHVNANLWVTSLSGGTELVGGLVGAVKLLPVRAGQIQGAMLGMAVESWSEAGDPLPACQTGELVVRLPAPSMPLSMWGDDSGELYRSTYFDMFPGVWRHGDLIRFDAHGGCYIEGRSDSTLNRYGVRLGTSEIYRALDAIPEVADAMVVCCEPSPGNFDMPLFVRLKPGLELDKALIGRINATLRDHCSPRHVPDRIVQVEQLPYTLTGKKMEVPLRKVLTGTAPNVAASRDSMMNPGALEHVLNCDQTYLSTTRH